MKTLRTNWAMFTKRGNARVTTFVKKLLTVKSSDEFWKVWASGRSKISKAGHGEVYDTAVREAILNYLADAVPHICAYWEKTTAHELQETPNINSHLESINFKLTPKQRSTVERVRVLTTLLARDTEHFLSLDKSNLLLEDEYKGWVADVESSLKRIKERIKE